MHRLDNTLGFGRHDHRAQNRVFPRCSALRLPRPAVPHMEQLRCPRHANLSQTKSVSLHLSPRNFREIHTCCSPSLPPLKTDQTLHCTHPGQRLCLLARGALTSLCLSARKVINLAILCLSARREGFCLIARRLLLGGVILVEEYL